MSGGDDAASSQRLTAAREGRRTCSCSGGRDLGAQVVGGLMFGNPRRCRCWRADGPSHPAGLAPCPAWCFPAAVARTCTRDIQALQEA